MKMDETYHESDRTVIKTENEGNIVFVQSRTEEDGTTSVEYEYYSDSDDPLQLIKQEHRRATKIEFIDEPLKVNEATSSPTCVCLVCKLLQQRFSTYNFQQKANVITTGRCTPPMNLDTKVILRGKEFTRHFKPNFYVKYKWLTGCSAISKLFCWPCLLFNSNETLPWTSTGFGDLNNFHSASAKHTNSKGHLSAVIKLQTFGNTPRGEHTANNHVRSDRQRHNDLVSKNREILKRYIDVTCVPSEPTNPNNYIDLLELLAKYDAPLRNHLQSSATFARSTQNELAKCVASVVLDNVRTEIQDAPFVAIALDEITATQCTRFAVSVRYVKLNADEFGKVEERFMRFVDVANEIEDGVFKTVADVSEEMECASKVVSYSYDGACLRRHDTGVPKTFGNAIFVNRCARRIDYVVVQSVSGIEKCKVFFKTLNSIGEFFSKSCKRRQALDVQTRVENDVPIQWNDNNVRLLIQTVHQHRDALLAMFNDVLDKNDQWDPETLYSAQGYRDLFETDVVFNFLLNVFSDIFHRTCVASIDAVTKTLNNTSHWFGHFWDKTNLQLPEPRRKRMRGGDAEATYRRLFVEIVGNLTQQIRAQSMYFERLKFVELCNFNSHRKVFPCKAFDTLKSAYGSLFDMSALQVQLSVLYDTPDVVDKCKTALEMLTFLKQSELYESYSNVFKLCQLVLTIPATVERRSDCTLERVRNFVGGLRGDETTVFDSEPAVIFVEKECIMQLSQSPRFYDDVIDRFAKVDRGIELHYK